MNLGTIAKGAALLHQEGAREVYACSTHAVFRYLPILIFEQHYFLDSEIVLEEYCREQYLKNNVDICKAIILRCLPLKLVMHHLP